MKKNCFARFAAAALSLAMLAGCGASQSSDSAAVDTGSADSAELTVFAAASMTETLNRIAEDYKSVDPNVTLTFNFASSGDLLTQIKEGADCDVFISAAPKQMNALDGSLKDDTDKNPDGLDELLDGTRIDLLENKVTLAVPEGNPKGIKSFDDRSTTRMFVSRSNSCGNGKSCIFSGLEMRCALCRIIWMPRITTPTIRPSTSGPKKNNAFARRWSLTVSFFVQILHQSGALCKTNLNTLLCKVTFLFRAFLL